MGTPRYEGYLAAIVALEPFADETTRSIIRLLREEILAIDCADLLVRCEMPLQVVSEANTASSEHWKYRWKRTKEQRGTTTLLVQSAWGRSKPPKPPLLIVLTVLSRTSHRMDSDNLPTSCKAIRDGIADWLGVNDGAPSLVWRYGPQSKHPVPGKFGVLVQVYGLGKGRG